ncbi:MAG TPA: DUF5320 domain-containing protein [Candidatus Eremiobacteraeota bacterium]|nr:MAG: hypothetical protein BWY64_02065 [bacterium ADurb.Bin363]HPZ07088.1 DUF5320 domain-containing protein [Candidatus Eremiobacteraeota bacterium]
MPGFDGTGPQGMGPRTGGGRGFCYPYPGEGYIPPGVYMPQYENYNYVPYGAGRGGIPRGGGRGRAWGGGRGCAWGGGRGRNWQRGGGMPFRDRRW